MTPSTSPPHARMHAHTHVCVNEDEFRYIEWRNRICREYLHSLIQHRKTLTGENGKEMVKIRIPFMSFSHKSIKNIRYIDPSNDVSIRKEVEREREREL